MMFRRPLVVRRRPLLRAAVVGGGAYALGRHQAKAQAAEERASRTWRSGPPGPGRRRSHPARPSVGAGQQAG